MNGNFAGTDKNTRLIWDIETSEFETTRFDYIFVFLNLFMILHVNFPILEMVFSSYFLLFFSTIPEKKLVNKPSISTIQILLSNFTKYFQVISCKVHLILYSDTIGPMRPKLDSSLCLIFFTYLPESQI